MATRGRVIPVPGVNEINVGINAPYNHVQYEYETSDQLPPVLGQIVSQYAQPEYTVTLHALREGAVYEKHAFFRAMDDLFPYEQGLLDQYDLGPYVVLWDLDGPLAMTNIYVHGPDNHAVAVISDKVWVAVRFDPLTHERLLPALYSRLESWLENQHAWTVTLLADETRPSILYRERKYPCSNESFFADLGIPIEGWRSKRPPFVHRFSGSKRGARPKPISSIVYEVAY